MGRVLRYLPYPGCLLEATAQTFQGRKLLRPDPESRDLVLGVLGTALEKVEGVNLVAYQYMSTHPHLLMAPKSIEAVSRFMCFVQGNISKEVGKLRDWEGTFWHARYDSTPVFDEEMAVARLRYLLENSVKENLVESIEDWPGANCVRTLLTGKPEVGTWYDRTEEDRARRRKGGKELDSATFGTKVEVPLVPLPFWSHLSQEDRAAKVEELLESIREEHDTRRFVSGITVLGKDKVQKVDPVERPKEHKRGKRVFCHTSHPTWRELYLAFLFDLQENYEDASKLFRSRVYDVVFPEGTFRPQGPFSQWTAQSPSNHQQWIESLSPG